MAKSFQKVNLSDSEWTATEATLIRKRKLTKTDNPQDADLIWSDCQWENNTPDPQQIKNLLPHQTINYFPQACETFRKDILTENINKFSELCPENFKDILPKSWNLSPTNTSGFDEFKKFMVSQGKNSSCQNLEEGKTSKPEQYFIVKENDEQRGVGIYITDDPLSDLSEKSDVVVSKYIGNPLLVDGCKFDFRIHVLVASLQPFEVYVHRELIMRMASVKYEKPNFNNRNNLYMHLTNLSLNKHNKNSVHPGLSGPDLSAASGYGNLARSYDYFIEYLESIGADATQVFNDMDEVIAKVLIASYDDLKKNYEREFGEISTDLSAEKTGDSSHQPKTNQADRAFQILGFDIMMDENLKSWFIEVNHNPDFPDDPKMVSFICRKTVLDAVDLMNDFNNFPALSNDLCYDFEYDLVYDQPNGFRKIDLQPIYQKIEDEKNKNLKAEKLRLKKLLDNLKPASKTLVEPRTSLLGDDLLNLAKLSGSRKSSDVGIDFSLRHV